MTRQKLAKQLIVLAQMLTAEDGGPADPKSKWNQATKHVLTRLVQNLPGDAKQIQSSMDKYTSDPRRYAPQLDILKSSVWDVYKLSKVVLRSLGEDVK